MKLIDVLNKIANGELKEGTKVKLLHDNTIYELDYDELVREEDGREIFDLYSLEVLAEKVELIEPQEPTECNHIWDNRLISAFSREKGEIVKMKECRKCGKWEETTDNTKIEELNADCEDQLTKRYSIESIVNKLNEVIRKLNKEG